MTISKIIHWFIPNISSGYASFLMSTNGLIHHFIPLGIDIYISYKKHPICFIMNNEMNILNSCNYFEQVIHIITNESQLEKLIQFTKQKTLNICCRYAYEKLCFDNISYKCYLKSIAFSFTDESILKFNLISKSLSLYETSSFIVIHIRMHDKYIHDKYTIPIRKIKYIEECIKNIINIIEDNIKILIISNSNQLKIYLNKKFSNYKIISNNEIIQHSSDKNIQCINIFNILYDFYIIQKAQAVYSIPLIYSKKTNILHGGNFSHFACQLFDKKYYLLNFLPIYSIYHDIESESMESLEN